MADFSKKILFKIATISAYYLLNKKVTNQKFEVNDLIYVPDRIIRKNPHSLTDALGRITKVKEGGRDFQIEMLYGTSLKRHFSDIVSDSATKSGSEVELIDPFQITDWRDKTPPDLIYSKFKLFIEKFKRNIFTQENQVSDIEVNADREPDYEELRGDTGDQRVQKAIQKKYPAKLDLVFKKLMDPGMTPDPIAVPKKFSGSKRPKNKRKADQDKTHRKNRYQVPKQIISKINLNKNKRPDKKETKCQKTNHQKSLIKVKKNDKQINISQSEDSTSQLRRSRRIPKLSAKYLESI